jgi:integrase
MALHLLTDAELRGNGTTDLHDGGGLYLLRTPTSASWVFRYTVRRSGKRNKMGLGPYPAISLRRARELAAEARSLAAEGIDPRQRRQDAVRQGVTVEAAIKAYFESRRASLKGDGVAGRWWSPIDTHVTPKIGGRGLADLTVDDIVDAFGELWREKNPTCVKVFTHLEGTLLHASAKDTRVDIALITKAKKVLGPAATRGKKKHHRALSYKDVAAMYQEIPNDTVHGQAFRFYLLTLPRTALVTGLPWSELKLKDEIWEIPWERDKEGNDFTMPLTPPALAILRWSRRVLGHTKYVFPNPLARKNPTIHANTFLNWTKANGWDTSGHGLRATFATWTQEEEICSRDIASISLQHKVTKEVEQAYNRSELIRQRRAVLNKWAEYITHEDVAERLQQRDMAKVVRDAENDIIGDGYAARKVAAPQDRGDKEDWQA